MDIHEYQAKELLSKFGVPIPRGGVAFSPEQATYRAAEIGGNKWVVKAQIHSGARGKAGGIKLCKNDMEIQHAAEGLLGKRLITHQTGPVGKLVSRLYIEEGADIAKEIYFALVMDRASERIMVVASAAGGMEIEEISAKQPETIIRISVDPSVGMQLHIEYPGGRMGWGSYSSRTIWLRMWGPGRVAVHSVFERPESPNNISNHSAATAQRWG